MRLELNVISEYWWEISSTTTPQRSTASNAFVQQRTRPWFIVRLDSRRGDTLERRTNVKWTWRQRLWVKTDYGPAATSTAESAANQTANPTAAAEMSALRASTMCEWSLSWMALPLRVDAWLCLACVTVFLIIIPCARESLDEQKKNERNEMYDITATCVGTCVCMCACVQSEPSVCVCQSTHGTFIFTCMDRCFTFVRIAGNTNSTIVSTKSTQGTGKLSEWINRSSTRFLYGIWCANAAINTIFI